MVTSIDAIRQTRLGITPSEISQSQTEEARYDAIITFLIRKFFDTAEWLPVEQSQPSRLQPIIEALDALQNIPNPPKKYARRAARFYILETYAKMLSDFPTPRFVPDDEGGIVIAWSNNDRRVRLSCRAELGQQSYLYYESPEVYDIEPELTPDALKDRLDWLNDA